VNNLPKAEREAPWPGIEPATSQLQVRRPNHYATTPHIYYIYIIILFWEALEGVVTVALSMSQMLSIILQCHLSQL